MSAGDGSTFKVQRYIRGICSAPQTHFGARVSPLELEPCGNHPRTYRRRRAEMAASHARNPVLGNAFAAAAAISSLLVTH